MKSKLLPCLLLCLVLAAASTGQPKTFALVGGTLVNTDGSGVMADSLILIQGNRITRVGLLEEMEVPKGAEVIRAAGKWIIPGLIDAHIHFFQSGGLYTRPDVIDLRKRVSYEKEMAAIDAGLPDTFARYLRCGITSVADMGGPFWNFEVRDRARATPAAPRVAVTGPLVSTYQPEALTTEDPPILKVHTPEEARALVRRQVEKKPDYIKIWYIVRKGEKAEDHLPIIRAVVDESRKNGLPVIVHATELETARRAVEAGCDVLVHSVFDKKVDDAFLDLLKKRNVLYIPTLMVMESYQEVLSQQIRLTPYEHAYANPFILKTLFELREIPLASIPERRRGKLQNPTPVEEPTVALANLKRVQEAGIPVAMGTDAGNIGTPHAACIFREFELMRKAGLSPLEILVASTVGGARMMGMEKELGRIGPGMLADLVVLNADPLKDIQNTGQIHMVIKDGRPFRPTDLVEETPADLVQRQVNAYNARDLEPFLASFDPEARLYFNIGDTKPFCVSRAGLRKRYSDFFSRTPKLHCEIKDRILQGDYVIDQEEVTGLEDGKVIRAVAVYEVKAGKITRVWFMR